MVPLLEILLGGQCDQHSEQGLNRAHCKIGAASGEQNSSPILSCISQVTGVVLYPCAPGKATCTVIHIKELEDLISFQRKMQLTRWCGSVVELWWNYESEVTVQI